MEPRWDQVFALQGPAPSIDNPEPIFGLAVSGRVPLGQLKRGRARQFVHIDRRLGFFLRPPPRCFHAASPGDVFGIVPN